MNANAHDIVPTHLAVQAMRDNGYKNAAYAIAELMDTALTAAMRYILKAESYDRRGARGKLYCIIAGSAVMPFKPVHPR
ncbi:MAG: hypothetical protein V7K38_13710 [Nostoc sp.]|uniref:hypothetical protein n=1 Tax=Nostoc sp. TaxID=1180 RepID=UPI002FF56CA2